VEVDDVDGCDVGIIRAPNNILIPTDRTGFSEADGQGAKEMSVLLFIYSYRLLGGLAEGGRPSGPTYTNPPRPASPSSQSPYVR